ncbi:MAG: host-nuclease inhibitor Gam family protein [Ignavibacteriaceae bacterium]
MLASIKDVEYAFHKMAERQILISKKEAEMNMKIAKIKENYEEETLEARQDYDYFMAEIEGWSIKNKLMFLKTRSIEFPIGKIGFRTNPPKVVLLNKKYNLKTAMELMKRVFDGKYVRSKEEIDKESILADYSGKKLIDETLAAVGLRVDQDETFFADVDYEKLKNFKTNKAG